MRWTNILRLRLRSLVRRGRVEQELDDELLYHFERLVEEYAASGMPPAQARLAARREMGGAEQRKEECRDARGMALVDGIRRDLAYALRALRRSPAFTSVAILSLALGIGANTAIFTLWNGVLRAPLPGVASPDELVILSNPDKMGMWSGHIDGVRPWLAYAEFEQLRDRADAFSSVMASQSSLETFQLRVDDGAWEEASGRLVSGGFFRTLGVGSAIGRVFAPEDDRVDASTAVISYAYWQRRFGGRPDVIGRTLTIRNAALTIAGVAPPGFFGETSGQQPDLWLPLRAQPALMPGRDWLHDTPPAKVMWLHVFARLKRGVTAARAEAEANAIFHAGLESFYGGAAANRRRELLDQRLQVQSGARGASATRIEFAQSLTALLAGVGVLLLIACANLANLLLARGAARAPEIAVRVSLGASRARVVRQLVTESLALAAIGGAAAIAVAYALHGALVQMMAESDPEFHMTFALDRVVLTFLFSATALAALMFGLFPAWQVTRSDVVAGLREQGRSAAAGAGQRRAGRLLVSLQLALALPLLVGAGLLARTVFNLQRADLGYPSDRLLLVRVNAREAGYERERRARLLSDLRGAIQQIPAVRAASFSQLGVFSGGDSMATFDIEGFAPTSDRDRGSALDVVGPGYFSTLGVPVVLGREILDTDRGGAMDVCVINESFARRFFERRSPIGMRITPRLDAQRRACQIVGVTKNARTQGLRESVEPRYFLAAAQQLAGVGSPTFLIRTARETAPIVADVRRAIQRIDPALPIVSASSLEEAMAPLTAQDRATARLAVVFGAVALALAAIGLYGVLAYGVSRRTGEIAIRIALGAQSGRVVSMILGETIGIVLAGLALGGGLAYAVSRVIDSRLYGVSPQDPLTLASATALLLAVALGAAYVPAERASRVDPMTALRQQ
jgi:putative ABC transport system permease protein